MLRRKRIKKRKRLPLQAVLSVIIPARNEARTITRVVKGAKRIIPRTEVIVVCNGSTDQTARLAYRAGARVIRMKELLGYDMGRAVGARYARGNVLLFIDGDFIIPTQELRRYYRKIKAGHDVVLNGYSGYKSEQYIHPTSEAKRLLNKLAGRPDLEGSSMTAVPHALSRRAVQTIGIPNLAIPPKAQVIGILQGLSIVREKMTNVGQLNRKRAINTAKSDPVEELILGDHAEAIAYLIERCGPRAGMPDFWRQRRILLEEVQPTQRKPAGMAIQISKAAARTVENNSRFTASTDLFIPLLNQNKLSVIIVAHNEQHTIAQVIQSVKLLKPKEIIVVENGSSDYTLDICLYHGAKCFSFPDRLGHDIGRAIGAREASGEVLLFLDGDIQFVADDLLPYIKACYGTADIALNDVNKFYRHTSQIDNVSMAKHFLNKILAVSHLGYSSLTAVPHAMKSSAIRTIDYQNLAIPPKAQAIAILRGLNIQQVKGVNVFQHNRRNLYNSNPANHVERMILGDHVEALQWVQSEVGERGLCRDLFRRRDGVGLLDTV